MGTCGSWLSDYAGLFGLITMSVALAFGGGFDIEVLAPSWPTARQWQLLALHHHFVHPACLGWLLRATDRASPHAAEQFPNGCSRTSAVFYRPNLSTPEWISRDDIEDEILELLPTRELRIIPVAIDTPAAISIAAAGIANKARARARD